MDADLLKKLRVMQKLAKESPVEGERKAAAAMLAKQLEKHGLTEADIEPPPGQEIELPIKFPDWVPFPGKVVVVFNAGGLNVNFSTGTGSSTTEGNLFNWSF